MSDSRDPRLTLNNNVRLGITYASSSRFYRIMYQQHRSICSMHDKNGILVSAFEMISARIALSCVSMRDVRGLLRSVLVLPTRACLRHSSQQVRTSQISGQHKWRKLVHDVCTNRTTVSTARYRSRGVASRSDVYWS